MTTEIAIAANSSSGGHFHVALGDLGTWALFIGAFVAAMIALRQLRVQQRDSFRLTQQLERQQADDVDFSWRHASEILIRSGPGPIVTTEKRTVLIVANGSRRPVRNVASWIQLTAPAGRVDPLMVGTIELSTDPTVEYVLNSPIAGMHCPLIRPKTAYGFLFEFELPIDDLTTSQPRMARPVVEFTDDADLVWQIDDDLRLRPVIMPPAPWRGLLSPP